MVAHSQRSLCGRVDMEPVVCAASCVPCVCRVKPTYPRREKVEEAGEKERELERERKGERERKRKRKRERER